MQERVTEGNVNREINKITNKFTNDYTLNDKDKDKLKILKDVKDYNVRKKILKDLVKKYLI